MTIQVSEHLPMVSSRNLSCKVGPHHPPCHQIIQLRLVQATNWDNTPSITPLMEILEPYPLPHLQARVSTLPLPMLNLSEPFREFVYLPT